MSHSHKPYIDWQMDRVCLVCVTGELMEHVMDCQPVYVATSLDMLSKVQDVQAKYRKFKVIKLNNMMQIMAVVIHPLTSLHDH